MKTFNLENKSLQYVNEELDARLGKLTSQGLIRSEQEYRRVIEDLVNRVDTDFNRVTNPENYVVAADDSVSSRMFTQLFEDIQADLRILYKELSDAKKILDLSREQNRRFFRRIKTKIAAMQKELAHFRQSSFNTESADYTFFESFDTANSAMCLLNLVVDEKVGEMRLKPVEVTSHNDPEDIENIELTEHPGENRDGGLFETTNPANTFEHNLTKGDRQMLKSGLWKFQLMAAKAPQVFLDIFGRGGRAYDGVVAYVDVTFSAIKFLNTIAVDPYGEFPLEVLGVLYKESDDSEFKVLTKLDEDNNEVRVGGKSSDWIYMQNFIPRNVKVLRIVFFQENYNVVSKLLSSVDTMVDKTVRDLAEKRYDKISYKYKFLDALPRYQEEQPETATLYDEVMNAIETERDLETLEGKISSLLIPRPTQIDQDISNWKLYNMGAWSIEPALRRYAPGSIGVYHSHDPKDVEAGFQTDEGAPTEVTLYTRQTEPNGTFIEWYIMNEDGTVEIPIIPNNDLFRNEVISVSENHVLDNSKLRSVDVVRNNDNMVIKLDFPIHPAYLAELIVFENGEEIVNANSSVATTRGEIAEAYNSTELYFDNFDIKAGNIYTIKYVPSIIDVVECWIVEPNTAPDQTGVVDVAAGMVFACKEVAQSVATKMETVSILKDVDDAGNTTLVRGSNNYIPRKTLCRVDEYNEWFQGGNVGIFVDKVIDENIDVIKFFGESEYNSELTRISWLLRGDPSLTPPSSETGGDGKTWSEFMAAPPIAARKVKRYDL